MWFLISCADPSRTFPTADLPGSLARLEVLAEPRDDATYRMFSSYDRSGGNDDGFEGTYSQLRVEDGVSVLAEAGGPGVITRIWFTHSSHEADGLLATGEEHLRVILDGEVVVDEAISYLFTGRAPGFPQPLVAREIGGFLSMVPLPFDWSMRVEVDGTDVRFYQVTWTELQGRPRGDLEIEAATELWTTSTTPAGEVVELDIRADHPTGLSLDRGVICSIELDSDTPATGWIEALWDGSTEPAVRVPLDLFFVHGEVDVDSVVAGRVGTTSYNRLPMPFEQAELAISSDVDGVLRVVMDGEPGSMRLVTSIREQQLRNLEVLGLVDVQGRGHLVGTVVDTVGSGIPGWLEGDERFFVDGELVAHGTGTEDYFNAGWYGVDGRLNEPGNTAVSGFPVYSRGGGQTRARAFRWHLMDVVPFAESLRMELEHGGGGPVDYRTAVFTYVPAGG